MGLLDLPNELLLAIVLLIGGFDILPCRLLCKRVQQLIDHSAESQLSIELAYECLALAPWSDVPAATLLDRLRRSREAWRTLRPTREKTISLPVHIDDTYKVYGYMLARGIPAQILPLDELAFPFAMRMLEFWEMPVGGLIAAEGEMEGEGEDKGTRGWHSKYMDMGMDIVDFTLDLSQDALFLVEKQGSSYIFHLRTLSNNLHHPDAKMVEMATEGAPELGRCDLHIRDCYIAALLVSLEEDEHVFTMWNWKSGECVLHELGVFSYTFLDACTPLLVVEKGDRIAFTARSPSLLGGANSNSKMKAKYLMFPDLSDETVYDHTAVFLDSELPQPESYPSTSFSRATVPAHRDHGVVALWISTTKRDPDPTGDLLDGEQLVFFLREMLARLFQQEQEQECSLEAEGEGEASYIMEWDDWGPEASRWFDAPSSIFPRCCSVHGYRFVTLVKRDDAFFVSRSFEDMTWNKEKYLHPPHTSETLYLLVFDFNPRPLRRDQYLPETENSCPSSDGISDLYVNIIAPSDDMSWDFHRHFNTGFFKQLACRVTLTPEPVDYDALVVCEDNIIAIQTASGHGTGGLGHVRVLTF